MKRFLVLIVLGILVFAALKSRSMRHGGHVRPPVQWGEPHRGADGAAGHEFAAQVKRQARQAAAEARQAAAEARQAINEARHEVREAWHEAREEIRQAYHDVQQSLEADEPPRQELVPPPPVPADAPIVGPGTPREEVEGLPVPIVPGTRVTEAQARPPAAPAAPRRVIVVGQGHGAQIGSPAPATPVASRTVTGQMGATEERADAEARRALRVQVLEWLDPEVPSSWSPPTRLLNAMVLGTQVRTIHKDYGTLYEVDLKVDASPQRRTELIATYNHELVQNRMAVLGGALGFVLICLAALSGYIRADEATKGYYTNRLRMLAAAGVGAGGVIIYNMVA
jgi:hypothetical protein